MIAAIMMALSIANAHLHSQHSAGPTVAAAAIAADLRALQERWPANPEAEATELPAEAVVTMAALRKHLREFLVGSVNPESTPAQLRSRILSTLSDTGIALPFPTAPATVRLSGIAVSEIQGHAGLLAVTATLSIPCGQDVSLYLLDAARERLILAYEPPEYTRIDGAFAHLRYAVSPTRPDGSYFIVAANVNPWCSSNWQDLRYSAFMVRGGKAEPVLSQHDIIYLGVDEPVYRLQVTDRTFSLEYVTQDPDPDLVTRHTQASYEETKRGFNRRR